MTCVVWVEKSRFSGIVLDVSASGLFVQTSASPPPGTSLRLEIGIPGRRESVVLQGRVARKKVVPPQLMTVAQGGLGVQLENAPEEYFSLIAMLQAEHREAPPEGEAAAPQRRFRVRGRQLRGSRSRALEVTAGCEDEARRKALAELGEDWQILVCEPAGG